ncbi:MAG TPA: hypothetical protein VH134_04315 [Candidatus Dormibacteraeota bacterium]|jgi:hypothetical protein|nr:hypothetical protein [Candidatus Dormibacteraeota bacterium]
MSGHESRVRDSVEGAVEYPGPEQMQAQVDGLEAHATARYRRLQDYSCLLNDAMRHADAMTRLEFALQQAQVL